MKRIIYISTYVVLLLINSLTTQSALNKEILSSVSHIEYKQNGVSYNLYADQTAVLVDGRSVKEINIPSTIEYEGLKYTVVGIANSACFVIGTESTTSPLEKVSIPNTVTYIGSNAFCHCKRLKGIRIPASVTSIGTLAFTHCDSLMSINVDEGNPVYDSRENCNALIETASNKLLIGCSATKIPNTITSIADFAFANSCKLNSIDIPFGVKSLGQLTFYNCKSLQSIKLPCSIEKIDDRAFDFCSQIQTIYCFSSNPPTFNYTSSEFTHKKLFIPKGTSSYYKNAKPWSTMDITEMQSIEELSIDKNKITLYIDEENKINTGIQPSNAFNKKLYWTSNNTSVVTVTQDGVIKGIKSGTASITVKAIDGSGKYAVCDVTVKKHEQYINWGQEIDTLLVDSDIVALNATTSSGLPISYYTSNNDKIATISKRNGISYIIPIDEGTATIIAHQLGNTYYAPTRYSKKIYVRYIRKISNLIIKPQYTDLYVGDKIGIDKTITPSNADNTALQWSSDNEDVATVSQDGKVSAIAAGIATITATTTDGSNISASCKVTVKKHPQSIVWEQSLDGLAVGGSVIEVNAKTSSGLPVSYYSSADERIVNFVSINGKLYLNPVSQGTTTVTAHFTGNNYYDDAELTRTVTVKEGPKATITFDSNGGSGVMAITALCGAQIDCPQSPERDGYTFTGWKPAFPATMPYDDMTLTAQWKPNKYKVTFIADGNVMQENKLDYGTEIIQPTKEPKKTGYSFIGWEPAVDATVPSHDVTYNAVFQRESHKITFDTDGGSAVEPITGVYDSEYSQPQQPVKAGYSFVGWHPTLPERIPAKDMAVKALWKLNSPLADRYETETDYAGYTVSLMSEASDTKIYYTTDGSEPTAASALYTNPIIIDNDITLKAIAIDKNNSKSEAATFAFSVIKMPKIQIGEGWNWISINANGKQSAISEVLSVGEWELGDEVKDDSKAISFSEEKKSWYGTLGIAAFDNGKMYKIHSTKSQTLTTNINAVNPEKVEISVMPGWNYIAYPLATTIPVAEALTNYDAEDGDIIKSQDQFSVYNAKTATWQGELKMLTPGSGYMIKRKAGARNVKFRFMANTGVTENKETVEGSKYANNMNVIANIQGLQTEEGDSIVAVCDNEVRGCASIQNDSKAYITIQGDKRDIVTMRLLRNGSVVAYANSSIQYADDAVVETIDNPTSIKFNKYDSSIGSITAIYDTNGRIMQTTDIDALPTGTYLVHSIQKGASKITKINKR